MFARLMSAGTRDGSSSSASRYAAAASSCVESSPSSSADAARKYSWASAVSRSAICPLIFAGEAAELLLGEDLNRLAGTLLRVQLLGAFQLVALLSHGPAKAGHYRRVCGPADPGRYRRVCFGLAPCVRIVFVGRRTETFGAD